MFALKIALYVGPTTFNELRLILCVNNIWMGKTTAIPVFSDTGTLCG